MKYLLSYLYSLFVGVLDSSNKKSSKRLASSVKKRRPVDCFKKEEQVQNEVPDSLSTSIILASPKVVARPVAKNKPQEIFNNLFFRETENCYKISKNFLYGRKVTHKMRASLVDWLVLVHQQLGFSRSTIFLCVYIVDAYLQATDVQESELKLVGAAAMLLAAKHVDNSTASLKSTGCYTANDVLRMEEQMLQVLNFKLNKPLLPEFLERFSSAAEATSMQKSTAEFLSELTLYEGELSSMNASYLSACSLCLAFKLLDGPEWNETLVLFTKCSDGELKPGMQTICRLVKASLVEGTSCYKAVTNKYESIHSKLSVEKIQELQRQLD